MQNVYDNDVYSFLFKGMPKSGDKTGSAKPSWDLLLLILFSGSGWGLLVVVLALGLLFGVPIAMIVIGSVYLGIENCFDDRFFYNNI